jgi:2-acylglycerol O-acyltransferase 2
VDGIFSYFRAEVIVEGEYDKDKNYCICYFPHSLFAIGFPLIADYLDRKHGMLLLFTVADVIFQVPIIRRIMTWWGSTSVAEKRLKKNLTLPFPYNAIMLQPDGIAGMFYGLKHEQIVLGKRRGFCRLALQTGTALVPCYTFGANDVWNRQFDHTSLMARISSKIRVSLVLWTDRFGIPFGVVPVPTKLVVALGPAIYVKQVENPTRQQIDELHAKFVTDIKSLYDRHKQKMGKEWVQQHEKLYLESENPTTSSKSD